MSNTSMSWDETAPADSRNAGLGATDIRSIKTNLRGALDAEHIFPSTGVSAGSHRKGSAVMYYGTASAVSSADTEGRLMLTSDTTELYHIGSADTQKLMPNLGQVIHGTSANTYPVRQLIQSGTTDGSLWSAGDVSIAFATAYSVAPAVFLTVDVNGSATALEGVHTALVGQSTTTRFTAAIQFFDASSLALSYLSSSAQLNWMSIGTVSS